jgi:hypothetical protein
LLTRPRVAFPQRQTNLLILDARRLRAIAYRRLSGDFSVDAISPDGKRAYLIQYLSGTDTSHYRVRAYDVATARLEPKPVVDPRERPDAMLGYPITRESSADGRWAYTLYLGVSGTPWHPFLHALDTAARRAVCVDLPALPPNINPFDARLRLDRGQLAVMASGVPVALVDTATLAVTRPTQIHRSIAPRPKRDSRGDGGALIAAAIAVLGGATALASLARRRRGRSRTATLGDAG